MYLKNPASRSQRVRARYAYLRHIWRPDPRIVIALIWLLWFLIERAHRRRKLEDMRLQFVSCHTVRCRARVAAADALGASHTDRDRMKRKIHQVPSLS
jgi:hypothetical protein